MQRGLLEAEGVTFLPDGRVDMASHLWRPDSVEDGANREQLGLF